MPKSSIQSGAVFVPLRERSRLALTFWLLEHSVAAAGVVAAGFPGYVKWLICLLIAVSLWLSRPGSSAKFLVNAADEWALPDEALYGLCLLPGTQFTRWWALLRFAAADGRRRSLPIWSDTLTREDWRRLTIRLREQETYWRANGAARPAPARQR